MAYSIGISWEEFWHLNPHIISLMIEGYSEREKIEIQKQNFLAHLQGQYFCEALLATVGNMLSKRGAKKYQYPEKPYELREQDKFTEEELQKQRELFVARLEAMKTNFELNHPKDGMVS